jgi:3-oxoadipate enol-lactonase
MKLKPWIPVFLVLLTVCQPESAPEAEPTPPESSSGFVDVEGGRLFYEEAGSGEAVLLIHGNAGDRRHWDDQFVELAGAYRVIRYDVRGFGSSSEPDPALEYSDYGDAAALLDHLGVTSAHVAGWSMGSGIAVDFAVAFPDRTLSLISVGPWVNGYMSDAAQDLFDDMGPIAGALADGGPEAATAAWMKAPFFATTIRDESAGERFASIASEYSWWAFANASSKTTMTPPASSQLSTIRSPTLILTAEHDIPACLEIARLLDREVVDSRLVEMSGTGHLLHMERPSEFNAHLLSFLVEVAGNGGPAAEFQSR